jgi:hypothetical protein
MKDVSQLPPKEAILWRNKVNKKRVMRLLDGNWWFVGSSKDEFQFWMSLESWELSSQCGGKSCFSILRRLGRLRKVLEAFTSQAPCRKQAFHRSTKIHI